MFDAVCPAVVLKLPEFDPGVMAFLLLVGFPTLIILYTFLFKTVQKMLNCDPRDWLDM